MTKHEALQSWVEEMARMCRPERIVWIDGSDAEKSRLEAEAVDSGEVRRLDENIWPGCFYHRTAENDVARVEHLTYICTPRKDEAGPTNNWMPPDEAYRRGAEILEGSMEGRILYVVPFCMGPLGSPFSKIGVELTDSIYVVLNMRIMTTVGQPVLDQLGTDGEFTKGLHSRAELDPDRRLILHFPQDNAIWSVGSGYGGNVLLGKKCLALRLASHMARHEGWMAEHMLVLGVERPDGVVKYIAAAFPSACGKTNLAMLVPPKAYQDRGYKVWTVGDDIAWMRLNSERQLSAVNPETGFFGVAPGTSRNTNPNALETIRRNTIFTNVVLGTDDTVWWEGMDEPPPEEGWDWRGNPWKPGLTGGNGKAKLGAHPNSRFTSPFAQCPSRSVESSNPAGVPITAIVFGGRRAHLAPLVYESFDWDHGVYLGATMASERTAAQAGAEGEVRRDPMAMLPFCGYNMADYFKHWINMGDRIDPQPKVFHVNWFRQDAEGNYLWPGFGENMRVLDWILERCEDRVGAEKTPIGFVPAAGDLNLDGLDVATETISRLLAVNQNEWLTETRAVAEYFEMFGDRLPDELWKQHEALVKRLGG